MATTVRDIVARLRAKDEGASDSMTKYAGAIGGIGIAVVGASKALEVLTTGVRLATQGVIESVKIAGEYEGASVRLQNALVLQGENTKENREELLNFADALSRTSLATENQILDATAFAKSMGASTEATKKLIAAATDLAAATGVEQDQAFRQVIRTLGGYAGELGEVIPELKDLSKEQLIAGGAADVLAAKFGGAGEALAQTFGGAINNLSSETQRFAKAVGAPLRDAITETINTALLPMVGELSKGVGKSDLYRKTILLAAAAVLRFSAVIVDALSPLSEFTKNLTIVGVLIFRQNIEQVTIAMEGLRGILALNGIEASEMGNRLREAAAALVELSEAEGPKEIDFGGTEDNKNRAAQNASAYVEGYKERLGEQLPEALGEVFRSSIEAIDFRDEVGDELIKGITDRIPELVEASKEGRLQIMEIERELQAVRGEETLTKEMEILDARLELERAAALERGENIALIEEEFRLKKQLAEEKAAKKKKDLEKKEKDAKEKQQKQQIGQNIEFLAEEFGFGKEVAIAKAIINTFEGATKALAQGGIFGPALAATVIAAGFAQVAKIRSTGFQLGGIVPGPQSVTDTQNIVARPGEAILPVGLTNLLLDAASGNAGGGGIETVELELTGDAWSAIADELSIRAQSGRVRLIANDLATARSVR